MIEPDALGKQLGFFKSRGVTPSDRQSPKQKGGLHGHAHAYKVSRGTITKRKGLNRIAFKALQLVTDDNTMTKRLLKDIRSEHSISTEQDWGEALASLAESGRDAAFTGLMQLTKDRGFSDKWNQDLLEPRNRDAQPALLKTPDLVTTGGQKRAARAQLYSTIDPTLLDSFFEAVGKNDPFNIPKDANNTDRELIGELSNSAKAFKENIYIQDSSDSLESAGSFKKDILSNQKIVENPDLLKAAENYYYALCARKNR